MEEASPICAGNSPISLPRSLSGHWSSPSRKPIRPLRSARRGDEWLGLAPSLPLRLMGYFKPQDHKVINGPE